VTQKILDGDPELFIVLQMVVWDVNVHLRLTLENRVVDKSQASVGRIAGRAYCRDRLPGAIEG